MSATGKDLDRAAELAAAAFANYSRFSGAQRAKVLRHIATRIENLGDKLIARTVQETALSIDRVRGELGRTCNQLRLFAAFVEEGSWVSAHIDRAQPERKPLAKPDIRSMLRPIGPVAVFGASNFPLAFSVAGGDTASALAAGNPVIAKAHPAHPGTDEFVGHAIVEALSEMGVPEGLFSLLFDAGLELGQALVQHPNVKAAGYTGSRAGGRALMDLAAARSEPIPFFAEMSSSNPVFILPGALRESAEQIAKGLHASFTLGAGQFCTKPGIVFIDDTLGRSFADKITALINVDSEFVLLTAGICASYHSGIEQRSRIAGKRFSTSTSSDTGYRAGAVVMETDFATFSSYPELTEELFGPATLLVRYSGSDELLNIARGLEGHLTATIHATAKELEDASELVAILEKKVGRIILNGFPTGVEVCHSMVHGGTYPAVSDARYTSVGTQAILRFARPVSFQNFPDVALPDELKDSNPLGIWRVVDGSITREPLRSSP